MRLQFALFTAIQQILLWVECGLNHGFGFFGLPPLWHATLKAKAMLKRGHAFRATRLPRGQ
jgi:hypothetical protein